MKVYYEKPDALKLIEQAIDLAEKYESLTGKRPNKIHMTQEEYDCLYNQGMQYSWFRREVKEGDPKEHLLGMGFYRDWETDRKSTRLNSSHSAKSRMPSSA